jgi:hypothetical protein
MLIASHFSIQCDDCLSMGFNDFEGNACIWFFPEIIGKELSVNSATDKYYIFVTLSSS